jgi:glycosyl transferase family 25
MSNINSIDDIKHAYYINLEHRVDRKEHVESQLNKIGINAQRFNAIKMENGAVGCSMSHLKILQDALKNNVEHVLIVEDDITFLDPELFIKQFNTFFQLHGNNWDVVLIAGNNMPPYDNIDDTCIKVSRCQTTTGYLVNGHYIKNLIQNIKMSITHLIQKPNEGKLFAIDKFWFSLQQADRWYLIIPPTVVQREDYSDIEKRITNYENMMQDLDKKHLFDALKEMRQKQREQYEQIIKNQSVKKQIGINFK